MATPEEYREARQTFPFAKLNYRIVALSGFSMPPTNTQLALAKASSNQHFTTNHRIGPPPGE